MGDTTDTGKVKLRPATQADAEFAFGAKKAALGEYVRRTYGWDEAEQRRLHEQRYDPSHTRIIASDGEDVGLLACRAEDGRLHILQLFLLPAAQGRGIGSHVLSQVLDETRRSQRPIFLRVLRSNPRARAFYDQHGFRATEETETHYYMERAR